MRLGTLSLEYDPKYDVWRYPRRFPRAGGKLMMCFGTVLFNGAPKLVCGVSANAFLDMHRVTESYEFWKIFQDPAHDLGPKSNIVILIDRQATLKGRNHIRSFSESTFSSIT